MSLCAVLFPHESDSCNGFPSTLHLERNEKTQNKKPEEFLIFLKLINETIDFQYKAILFTKAGT